MNTAMLLSPKVNIACLESTDTIRQGIESFRAHGYTAVPVLYPDGRYCGTISERDFLTYILDNGICSLKEMESTRIENIIRKGWNPTVSINAPLSQLLARILDTNFVPVVDDRSYFVGIVTRKSVLSYLEKEVGKELAFSREADKNSLK